MPTQETQIALSFGLPEGAPSRTGAVAARPAPARLGLMLTHGSWLEWLADEWWPLSSASPAVRLGVGAAPGAPAEQGGVLVVAWIDPGKLAAIDVPVWRKSAWIRRPLADLDDLDREVAWPGPIPLHAVTSFSVATESERTRLLAMSRGFSNVAPPAQPIEVAKLDLQPATDEEPPRSSDLAPPADWNARRGAAVMALWAVPAIRPWLDLLCTSLLSLEPGGSPPGLQYAPWLAEPPWRPRGAGAASGDPQIQLWRAALDVLGAVRRREGWRPQEIVEAIRARACAEHGAAPASLDVFVSETRDLLNDELPVETTLRPNEPVGSAIQLVLLRPAPERFAGWRQDLPGLPPGVWWTGAILSGLVHGYRDLEQQLRGPPGGRHRLALRTWQLGQPGPGQGARWPGMTGSSPDWVRKDGRVSIRWDGEDWADQPETARGRWYEADLERKDIRQAAMSLAGRLQPSCLRHTLELGNLLVPFSGPGEVRTVEGAPRRMSIEGTVRLQLPPGVSIVEDLDVNAFHAWLARDEILEPLPEPSPIRRGRQVVEVSDSRPVDVPGLTIALDLVTEAEEGQLLATIEHEPWRKDLSRRVQHYGWEYNYKARKVDPAARLGPLPVWAARLGERLVARGLVPEPPDQVIVNEYVGKQGITKHIDCIPCFKGSIAMLSLGEDWEMWFWPPEGGGKAIRLLPRRSVAVLSGEARERWSHEIPRRLSEPWGRRGRRVSMTFRKVVVPAAVEPAKGARGKRGKKQR